MPLDFLAPNLLIPLDILIYLSLILGVFKARSREATPRVEDPVLAFALLEKSLQKAFPDLPEGFTLREALSLAERLRLKVDWGRVQLALERYEAFRYGGATLPEKVQDEVLRLAAILPRGVKVNGR
ncbi:MAG: hypothetical protein E6K86_07045 [Thaumarchaeota archaeon]|nr:MAG: hypothetical protein E6K86_07045 [Nitrososphaerota archaeon]